LIEYAGLDQERDLLGCHLDNEEDAPGIALHDMLEILEKSSNTALTADS
jgi:hypothetical protein